MKTLTELLELVSIATEKTSNLYPGMDTEEKRKQTRYDVFFIDFAGHVNQISIRYYSVYDPNGENTIVDRCKGYLNDENHIQELYYFLKNRLF